MSNNLTAFSPEYWSNRVQRLLKKALVSRELANMEESALLSNGVKVHRPYHSDVKVNTYTKGTAVTVQDITATDEYLTVDQTREATVYVDAIDVVQNKYDTANVYTDRIAYQLKRDIDGKFLDEVVNASLTFDDSDLGGTSGVGVTVSPSNLIKIFSQAEAKMNNQNIEDTKPRYAVVTPALKAVIQQSMIYNGFTKADSGLDGVMMGNGYIGKFMNFNIYSSTNVYHTQTLTSSANYSADETVVVGGVTFTFKASPSAAGEVDVGTDEATSMANLAAAINGGAGAGTAYIAISDANRITLSNARVVATVSGSHDVIVTSSGPVTKSETSATAARGTQLAYCYFAQQGATDMVIQRDVTVQQNKVPDKTGYNYLCYTLYGVKTFTEGANRGMKVKVIA